MQIIKIVNMSDVRTARAIEFKLFNSLYRVGVWNRFPALGGKWFNFRNSDNLSVQGWQIDFLWFSAARKVCGEGESGRVVIAFILLAVAVIAAVYGRVQTFHMSEGEALAHRWGCWFTATWAGILSVYFFGKR